MQARPPRLAPRRAAAGRLARPAPCARSPLRRLPRPPRGASFGNPSVPDGPPPGARGAASALGPPQGAVRWGRIGAGTAAQLRQGGQRAWARVGGPPWAAPRGHLGSARRPQGAGARRRAPTLALRKALAKGAARPRAGARLPPGPGSPGGASAGARAGAGGGARGLGRGAVGRCAPRPSGGNVGGRGWCGEHRGARQIDAGPAAPVAATWEAAGGAGSTGARGRSMPAQPPPAGPKALAGARARRRRGAARRALNAQSAPARGGVARGWRARVGGDHSRQRGAGARIRARGPRQTGMGGGARGAREGRG
jgi:hypothetical protein